MGSGVPSGLQNQYEELGASWVGSIPTHSRQLNYYVWQTLIWRQSQQCLPDFFIF